MIATYLLDIHTLPDPLEQEEELALLPKERIDKIRSSRHLGARKQSFGAGLLLWYGLRQIDAGTTGSVNGQTAGSAGLQTDILIVGPADIRAVGQGKKEPDREVEICQDAYGKPQIPHIAFNLSHSGDCVILSIQKDVRQPLQDGHSFLIGCDIEQVKTYNKKIAKRFFTEAEYHSLESIGDKDLQDRTFCRYWTRKESVMKLTGLGIALPMDLFDISTGTCVPADRDKVMAWQRWAGQKLEHPVYQAAARILAGQPLVFQEYDYELRGIRYCITVCSIEKRLALTGWL